VKAAAVAHGGRPDGRGTMSCRIAATRPRRPARRRPHGSRRVRVLAPPSPPFFVVRITRQVKSGVTARDWFAGAAAALAAVAWGAVLALLGG
jgi:hypothetical protein